VGISVSKFSDFLPLDYTWEPLVPCFLAKIGLCQYTTGEGQRSKIFSTFWATFWTLGRLFTRHVCSHCWTLCRTKYPVFSLGFNRCESGFENVMNEQELYFCVFVTFKGIKVPPLICVTLEYC